jgi:hypothetical protein
VRKNLDDVWSRGHERFLEPGGFEAFDESLEKTMDQLLLPFEPPALTIPLSGPHFTEYWVPGVGRQCERHRGRRTDMGPVRLSIHYRARSAYL